MMLVVRFYIFICVSSFVFHSVFLCQLHAHIHRYWPRLFLKKTLFTYTLTVTMFAASQSSVSLLSFMVVSAAVSEIHGSNQNKKEKENLKLAFFNSIPFLGT